ncbi:hypothetical protein EFD32_1875 [Enterococcus faecalis D32]|nr:hypothetical protein EFD32_1875 [Enterococcus faecalis D32]
MLTFAAMNKKTSHMAMENKKAHGFLFQIYTKTNKKEWLVFLLSFFAK